MTLRQFIRSKYIKQRGIAITLAIHESVLSTYLSGKNPLPKKYVKPLARFLDIPESKIFNDPILKVTNYYG